MTTQEIGGGKTRMSIESEFLTGEGMEQHAAVGVDEGRRRRSDQALEKNPEVTKDEHEASQRR